MRRSRGSARRTRGSGRTRRPGNRVVQRRRPNRSSKRRASTKSPRRPITRNMSRHSGRKSIQRRIGGRSVARRTAARSARRMGSARRRGSARRMGGQGSMGAPSSGVPGGHSYRGRQSTGRATDMTSAKVRFGPNGLDGAGLPQGFKYQRDRNAFNAAWRVIQGKHGDVHLVNNKNVRNSRVKGGATNMQVKQADGTYKSVTQN